jgi:hypothetical protein
MANDPALLLRGLGAAFSNTVPQLRQDLASEREAQMRQQEFEALQGQRAQQGRMQNFEMMQARQQAALKDADAALKLAASGNYEQIIALADDRMNLDEQLGGSLEGDMTPMLKNMAQRAAAGDRQAASQLNYQLTQVVARGYASGALEMPEVQRPEIIPGASIVDGQVITRDAQGNIVAQRPQGFQQAPKPDESFADEAKDARTFIRQNVGDITNKLSEITSSFNKVASLEPQMRAGNRSAINAAIMNVARLISPGVVTDRDAAAFSGANTNIGAMYEFLVGKGVDVKDLVRIYDPANPEVFNPDELLAVAKSVTASSIPSLMARFEDQKNIANQYRLSPQFVSSFLQEDGETMRSVKAIQSSLGSTQAQAAAPQGTNFRSVQEAETAVNQGIIPVGAQVNIVDASGRVVESFMVEE